MKPITTLSQRDWTPEQLKKAGFHYYLRRKQLIMAGRLPASAAPLKIMYDLEEVYAEAGDILCYDPGTTPKPHLADYDFWSVKPDLFKQTYRKWDDPNWVPTPSQAHLMRLGCRPYYKHAGIWAMRLAVPMSIQSLESQTAVPVAAGTWLAIGSEGEPWHMDNKTFQERYLTSDNIPSQTA